MKARPKGNKKHIHKVQEQRRRNWLWTSLLFPVYIILTCLLTFYGHKMEVFQFVLFLLCLAVPMILSLLWVGMFTKTRNKQNEWVQLFKAMLLALPFGYFSLNAPLMYREYSMEKYGTYTTGVVTNTFIKYSGRRHHKKSLCAAVNFYCDGQVIHVEHGMQPGQYEIGDSVRIVYSSDEPEFYSLIGKKN